MTFRKITFIFIGLLLSLLLLLQFWLIQNFTKDVSSKIGEAAFEVSLSTAKTLMFKQPQFHFKSLAVSTHISTQEQSKIIESLSRISNEISINLKDGIKDKFLSLKSSGVDHKIKIPRTGIEKSLDAMSQKILLSAFSFIFLGLLLAAYFSRLLADPLKSLQEASKHVGLGNFGFQVKDNNQFKSIELKNAISAFNEMSNKIKQLQSENEILQKQAQFSELSEITRGLAHTIRNPLNTLNLAIDELSTVDDKASKKELSRISKHQVQRIDQWVRSLMDIMSSDNKLVEPLDLNAVIKSCITDISLHNTSKVKIDFSKSGVPLIINAIKPELKSLLQSLMSNAVESTEMQAKIQNSPNNHVRVIASQSTKGFVITIIDKGVGFKQEILNKLFSPHNTNKTYGAGMGLYLAHRIVTLKYSGSLEVLNIDVDVDVEQLSTRDEKLFGAKIVLTLNNRV